MKSGAGRESHQALGFVLGGKFRRGDKAAEIFAFAHQTLQRDEIGLHRVKRLLLDREVKERLGITRAHIRRPGIVRHVKSVRYHCNASPEKLQHWQESLEWAQESGAFGAPRRSPHR